MTLVWKRTNWPDERFEMVVVIDNDGSMRWEPEGIMGRGNDGPYFKIDGPRVPGDAK
jgi:hypothetical protein